MFKYAQFLLIVTLIQGNSHAQSFQENFLGDEFMQYKGSLLKLRDDAKSGFQHTFYSDLKYCQALYDNNVIYPDTEYRFLTVSDSLKNRIFRVEAIVDKNGKTFSGSSYFDVPIFQLKDTITGQVLYYKYDKKYDFNFPFLVSNLTIDIELLCSKIQRRVDEFTDEVALNSPIINGSDLSSMIIYKTITGTKAVYDLNLRTHGSTVNVGISGVIILFQDNTKLNKSVEVDVEADEKGFEYSAYIALTASDLEILSTKKIRKFRLYIYDKEVPHGEAERFMHYVKCIRDKK